MKYKIVLFFLGILILSFIPNSDYIELNHLQIIQSLEVQCTNLEYFISLKEIIPLKENNSVEYHYKDFSMKGKSILLLKKKFDKNHHFDFDSYRSFNIL